MFFAMGVLEIFVKDFSRMVFLSAFRMAATSGIVVWTSYGATPFFACFYRRLKCAEKIRLIDFVCQCHSIWKSSCQGNWQIDVVCNVNVQFARLSLIFLKFKKKFFRFFTLKILHDPVALEFVPMRRNLRKSLN